MYIREQMDWPKFTWDNDILARPLARISREQGRLLGKMEGLGFELRDEAHLHTLNEDVVKTSEIEGETLERHQVRASIARLGRAIEGAQDTLASVMDKARFWEQFAKEPLNERQIKVLNIVMDGFEGKFTTSKWARLAKCSQDTAYRDMLDLIERGALQKDPGGGRSTSYSIRTKP